MKNRSKNLLAALAVIAAASPLMAGEASAKMKEMNFSFVQDQFATMPTIAMRYNGDKWVWDNKGDSYNVKMRLKIRSSISVFDDGKVFLPQSGAVIWQMATNYQTKKIDDTVTLNIGKAVLSPYVGSAANLCSVFGGAQQTVRDMDVPATLKVYHRAEWPTWNGKLPIKVACLPVEPHRTPVALKVTDLKLYTLPAKPKCGQPVKLVTEIHTNKPGKVEFQLFRRDGEKQEASLVTEKVANGYAKRWAKTYKYDQSIKREYLVVVRGHEFSTQWVPVEVKCGANADIARPGALAN